MKQLPPLRLKPKYWELIEKEIMKLLNQNFYKDLFAAANLYQNVVELEVRNARDALEAAVRAGTVDWDGGTNFTGNFNAGISARLKALGGTFNRYTKSWVVPRGSVPANISMASAEANDMFTKLRKAILKTLDDSTIDSVFAHNFNHTYLDEKYDQVIEWMNDDFQKAVKSIAIPPKLTPEQRKIISREWTNNLKLYIRGWTKENIVNLRTKIQKKAFAGHRAETMVKMVQANYGVAINKAKFLARQETSLLMSKFRETRYRDVGIEKYKWSTSHDARVRDDHQHLDGKIFFFSSPPVTDHRTGARNNPGEDFNCRCQAIPVIDEN